MEDGYLWTDQTDCNEQVDRHDRQERYLQSVEEMSSPDGDD